MVYAFTELPQTPQTRSIANNMRRLMMQMSVLIVESLFNEDKHRIT
jgi:hypothetical protein